MARQEMAKERKQGEAILNYAERGEIGRSQIENLFKTHYVRMYHLALTILFDEAESKDVVSEVFANLLISRTVLMPDKAEGYLMTSVRHRCQNVLRHKQVHERFVRLLTEDGSTPTYDSTVDEQLQMQELMCYVKKNLPPMSREIFRLRYLREMTCQEVADALGVSRQTVHTHLKQTMEKIQMYFNSNS